MRLKGRTAFVSGAGRNIGRAIALTFAREGADLVLISRSRRESLEAVARECEALGAKTLALLADVGDPNAVDEAARKSREHFPAIDILVNAVGIRPHNLPWEIPLDEWHAVFAVNVHSTYYLTRAIVPDMIRRGAGGSIMALGGMSALTPSGPASGANVASKHALFGFIKSLARALGPHNIRANLINPGIIESERANPEWYPEGTAQTGKALTATPLGRFGRVQEVADLALFLASDESTFITGEGIACSGGRQL